VPDTCLDHATRGEIFEDTGLTSQHIARNLVSQVMGMKVPVARPLPMEGTSDESIREVSDADGKA
jgi:1-deoxy-D-xylulose-5-phosphate synthase